MDRATTSCPRTNVHTDSNGDLCTGIGREREKHTHAHTSSMSATKTTTRVAEANQRHVAGCCGDGRVCQSPHTLQLLQLTPAENTAVDAHCTATMGRKTLTPSPSNTCCGRRRVVGRAVGRASQTSTDLGVPGAIFGDISEPVQARCDLRNDLHGRENGAQQKAARVREKFPPVCRGLLGKKFMSLSGSVFTAATDVYERLLASPKGKQVACGER